MGEDPREQSEAAFRPTVVMRSQSANKSLINRRDCRCPDLQTEIIRSKIGAGIRVSGTLTPVIRNHRSTLTPTEFVTRWENNWSEVSTRTAGPAELAGALQKGRMHQPEIHALQVDPTWGAAHNFRTKAESQPRRTDRLSSFRSPSLSLAG